MSSPEKIQKILVVDDEEQIRRVLRSILQARRYEVLLAASGEEALDTAFSEVPDLIILDLHLPGKDGFEVCRELRAWSTVPILVLTVRGRDSDKINALDGGADDYLTKPFSAGELLARIRALLRRSTSLPSPPPVIAVGELEIDCAHRMLRRSCVEIDLTRIEFDILSYLAQNLDRIVTYRMMLEKVWGPEYSEDTKTLRVHISNLRKKVEPHPAVPRYIITEPGIGFRLSP